MSDKIQNCLSNESIGKVDHLINIKEIIKSEKTFNNSNLLTNDSIFDEKFSTEQSTIFTAIENFIECEKCMTFGDHKNAFIYLLRFLTITEKLFANEVNRTEEYRKNPDIYDYYMSEDIKRRIVEKLNIISKHINIGNVIIDSVMSKNSDENHTLFSGDQVCQPQPIEKCSSIPKDMSFNWSEVCGQNQKYFLDIFDFNNLIRNENYVFGTQKSTKLKNQNSNNKNFLFRKSLSLDDNKNVFESKTMETNEKTSQNQNQNNVSIKRIENYMSGYNKIVAPLVMEETIRKIEEYKRNVELKSKSNELTEYSWQINRKNYIIKALKI